MVGVTSVNLGGIEVDVEDVADRLRRLKVPSLQPAPHPSHFGGKVIGVFLAQADGRIASQLP
jgi:hypothetical protein